MQGRREADELAGRAVGMSAHVEDEGLLQRRHHHRDQLEAAVRRLRSRSAEVSALHVNEDDSAKVPEVGGAAGRRRIEDLVHSVTEILHVRHAELVSRHGEQHTPAQATRSSAVRWTGQKRLALGDGRRLQCRWRRGDGTTEAAQCAPTCRPNSRRARHVSGCLDGRHVRRLACTQDAGGAYPADVLLDAVTHAARFIPGAQVASAFVRPSLPRESACLDGCSRSSFLPLSPQHFCPHARRMHG